MKQAMNIASERMQHYLLQSVRLLIWLTCLSLAQPFSAMAQGNEPAPLQPEAQEAVDKGIIAAKVPDYPLAIRYFEQARKLAPEAPVIYLNLGLAESKIPGRELRAMAWFGAYLTAYPDAPNAAAVKEQIGVLDVRSQSNVSRLLRTVQDAAENMTDHDSRNSELVKVAGLFMNSGDFAAAREVATFLKGGRGSDRFSYNEVLTLIAVAQAANDDMVGARKTIDSISPVDLSHYDMRDVGRTLLKLGDVAGARKMFSMMAKKANEIDLNGRILNFTGNWEIRGQRQVDSVLEQVRAGDVISAEKTLAQMESDTRSSFMRGTATATVALGYAANGGGEESRKLLAIARQITASLDDTEDFGKWRRSEILQIIAQAEAKLGDPAARTTMALAQSKLELIDNPDYRSSALIDLGQSRFKIGDLAGLQDTLGIAQVAADHVPDSVTQHELLDRIAAIRVEAGLATALIPTVADWLIKLDDDNQDSDSPLNTGSFLDLARHLKSLPSDDADKIYFGMYAAAEKIVKAQNVITGMLKQQVGK